MYKISIVHQTESDIFIIINELDIQLEYLIQNCKSR